MIWLGQTSSNADSAAYFSTKRAEVAVIKKSAIGDTRDFCTCIQQCIPDLVVFTDGLGDDPLKNDWTSFFMKTVNEAAPVSGFPTLGETVVWKIIDMEDGTETTLVDSTHGELKAGNYYTWFKVDWYKIYLTLGLGRYKICAEGTSIVVGGSGEIVNQFESAVYNLIPYSDTAANRTVRIYSKQEGKLHHGNDYSNLTVAADPLVSFPYEQQTRLPGRLVSVSPDQENHRLVLNDGERSSYQVKDQMKLKYELHIHLVGDTQINPVIFDDLFGSEILVTDYNVYNHVNDPRDYKAKQYIDLPVVRTNTDIPNPRATARRRTYRIEFDYDYDNVFKTNN